MEICNQDIEQKNIIKRKEFIIEVATLFVICMIIFFLSTLQVKDIVSIWNQNDELGTWQGAAWILGLDWSEVTSINGYYGYGYGFILALFIKFFGHDTILMTHMAIYFQAFMHTSSVFIAWRCIKRMFPSVSTVVRVVASSISILSIPDLFYNYMFFSECILRFLVWIIFGVVVSYSYNKKWYKLLLINLLSIYAFSIHQRCILLIGLSVLLFFYEAVISLKNNGVKKQSIIWTMLIIIVIILFYKIEYQYAQASYISFLYSAGNNSSVGTNLLSERGYTVKKVLQDIVFNQEAEQIAFQNILGLFYYINAIDCGFIFYGFFLCFTKIKDVIISKKSNILIPYIYMSSLMLFGILLVAYQYSNQWVYTRVELMHYGRYCSYLFAPMIMFGIIEILEDKAPLIRRNALIIIIVFLIAGISTYRVLKGHNVHNLFAFSNACPGIKSIYYTENPYTATLYHTVIGVLWILIPTLILVHSKKYSKLRNYIEIGTFIMIAAVWIYVANQEWFEQHEIQNEYVTQTYDLQNILQNIDEFVAFKSFPYGSGLLQYNNMYAKIHVCQTLDELGEEEEGLLVISQKGIDEMTDIMQKYRVEYENERYFVWRYTLD